ncbi:hypothetical protein GLW00_07450 [Halobacillus litoralis]|uniref:DUF4047 domain-containing protein n=1 Tax=Halobacillus litoralis TaxID=45668 RepID=A0A845F9W0_9BACI|nr:hypothetical protein [Halobacillus litoralis]MYL70679.1 hypothetical protein [Halobacillus litoralis]
MKRRKFLTQVILSVCILCVVIFLSSQLVSQTKASFMDHEQRSMKITTAPIFPGTAEDYTAKVEKAFHSVSQTYAKLIDLSGNEESLKDIEKALEEAAEKRIVFKEQTESYHTVHNEAMKFFHKYDFSKYPFLLHEVDKVKEVNKKFERLSSQRIEETIEHLKVKKENRMKKDKESPSQEGEEEKIQEEADQSEEEAEKEADDVEVKMEEAEAAEEASDEAEETTTEEAEKASDETKDIATEEAENSSEGTDEAEQTKGSEKQQNEENADSVKSTSKKSEKNASPSEDKTKQKKEQPAEKSEEEERTQQTNAASEDSDERPVDEETEKQPDGKGVSMTDKESDHESQGGQDDEEDL